MEESVFECRLCGQCCKGRGGIVLSPADLRRLANWLGKSIDAVRDEYAEMSNGKLKIRCGADGFCIFFRSGMGCTVHPGKPAICRAWPFFRGNLIDEISFDMAREFCPGISPKASFASFVREGLEYLQSNGLLAQDRSLEAEALVIKAGDLAENLAVNENKMK